MVKVKSLKSVEYFSNDVAVLRAAGKDLTNFRQKWTYKQLKDETEQLLIRELYESVGIPDKTPFVTVYCDQFGLFDARQAYCPYIALNAKQQLCLFVGFHEVPIEIKDDGSILLNNSADHELDTAREVKKDRLGGEYTVLTMVWYSPTYNSYEGDEPLDVNAHTLVFPVWLTDNPSAQTFVNLIGKKNKGKECRKILPYSVKYASNGGSGWVNLNRLFLSQFEYDLFTPTDIDFSGWELKKREDFTSIEVYPTQQALAQIVAKYGDYVVKGVYGDCRVSEITRITLSSSNRGADVFINSDVQPGTLTVFAPNERDVTYIPKFGTVLASHQAQAALMSGGTNKLKQVAPKAVESRTPELEDNTPAFDEPSAADILG
jgi:hypothetical protein